MYVCVCVCVCVCVYACMHVCIYVCVCVCVHWRLNENMSALVDMLASLLHLRLV